MHASFSVAVSRRICRVLLVWAWVAALCALPLLGEDPPDYPVNPRPSGVSPLGDNRKAESAEDPFPSPFVKDEDLLFYSLDRSGEPNQPQMLPWSSYPVTRQNALILIIPEEVSGFSENYLRPAHIFSEVELPSISQVELEGPRIALDAALRLALTRNLDVQILRMEVDIQESRVRQARGEFDPTLEVSTRFEETNRPQNTQEFLGSGGNIFDPGIGTGEPRPFDESAIRFNMKLEGKTPTGLSYEVGTRLESVENSIQRDSEANLFRPEYTTFLGVTVTQPLLRDFGREVNLASARAAQKNKEVAMLEFRSTVLQIVSEVIKNYYDFILAYNEMRLRRLEAETLTLLAEQRKDQVERGLVSIRQLREIQARVGESLDKMLVAEQRFEEKRTEILRRISGDADPDFMRNFLPVGQLSDRVPGMVEERLYAEALALRPDYLQRLRELELDEIELGYVRNQAKSSLNLVGSTGLNGLGSDPYDAWERSVDQEFFEASVALVFQRPWNNATANARVREIQKRRIQSVLELRQIEHNTRFGIRAALSSVDRQKIRLSTAAEIRSYFQEELEEEQVLLEKGDRSIYDTLQFFSDLYEARVRELTVLTDLNKSLIDLWVLNGTLLEKIGIRLQ